MIVNNPATKAEVEAAFADYERALVTNDVASLDAFFWPNESAIRYGGGDCGVAALSLGGGGEQSLSLVETFRRNQETGQLGDGARGGRLLIDEPAQQSLGAVEIAIGLQFLEPAERIFIGGDRTDESLEEAPQRPPRKSADEAVGRAAAVENDDGRQGLHAELGGDLRLCGDIEPHMRQLAFRGPDETHELARHRRAGRRARRV